MEGIMKYIGTLSTSGWALAAALVIHQGALAQDTTAPAVPAPVPAPAPAQTAPAGGGGLGEIIVTAEKRSTNVQKTPIAIQAIDGDKLKGAGPVDIQTIAQTLPSVLFGQANGQSQITIRGIGNDQVGPGFEGRTAFYIDGVYLPSLNGVLGSLYDLERVEIAEGPQGDLYGRNATAGAVEIVTKKPSLSAGLNGYFQLTGGNYKLVEAQGAIGAALSSTLAFRVAGDVVSHSGYDRNLYTNTPINDEKTQALRGSLLWQPAPSIKFNLSGDYFREDDANYTATYGGGYNMNLTPAQLTAEVNPAIVNINGVPTKIYGTIPTGVFVGSKVPPIGTNLYDDSNPHYQNTAWGIGLTSEFDLSPQFTIRSITGYRYNYHNQEVPTDFTTAQVVTNGVFERVKSVSQELQLVGNVGIQHFVVGAYYFHSKTFASIEQAQGYPITQGPVQLPNTGNYYEYVITAANLSTTSLAGYVHDEIAFTHWLSLTLGARYTHDHDTEHDITSNIVTQVGLIPVHSFPYPIPAIAYRPGRAVSYNNFSPRVTLSLKPDSQTLIYATWSKGFKSGGFNPGADQPPVAATVLPPFAPEKITDYELGLKRDWFDHKLRTNIAIYYYDYKNLQVQQKDQNANVLINNAASATLYGLEANIEAALTHRLRVTGGASLVHSRYDEFCNADSNRSLIPTNSVCAGLGYPAGTQDLRGNKLNRAPSYVFNLGFDYRVPTSNGAFTAHFDANYTAKEYFNAFNVDTMMAPRHELLNMSIRYDHHSGVWAEAWMKNMTDRRVVDEASVSALNSGANISDRFTAPRTVGGTVGYNF
jgi:iron complex outermembrane receptor protein